MPQQMLKRTRVPSMHTHRPKTQIAGERCSECRGDLDVDASSLGESQRRTLLCRIYRVLAAGYGYVYSLGAFFRCHAVGTGALTREGGKLSSLGADAR